MLKIGVAANAFKGSLSAITATHAIAEGLRRSALNCEVVEMPLADGGDGTLEVLMTQPDSVRQTVMVQNPLKQAIQADYGMIGETAVIEMARASGLTLLGNQLDPMHASTYGTGELIRHAITHGAKRVILGVGGSATTDGGAGCLQALGMGFLDEQRNSIPPGGEGLRHLVHIEGNPPIGEMGAAAIFAPQKGANPEQVRQLEANLTHFFTLLAERENSDVRDLPGGGAAGALAGGLAALAGAKLVPGAKTIIDLLGYAPQIADCDLIFTGEGRLDFQTARGKAPAVVAEIAARSATQTIAITGSYDLMDDSPFQAVFSLVPGVVKLEDAMRNGEQWLMQTAQQLGNLIAVV